MDLVFVRLGSYSSSKSKANVVFFFLSQIVTMYDAAAEFAPHNHFYRA